MRVFMFPLYCAAVMDKVTFCVIVTEPAGGDGEPLELPLA
jgi:hypothetical protein